MGRIALEKCLRVIMLCSGFLLAAERSPCEQQGELAGQQIPEVAGPRKSQRFLSRKEGTAAVAGRVVTRQGEPLPKARVQILELGLTTVTDDDGEFQFTDLPLVQISITATADGYYASTPLKLNLASEPEYELEIVLTERVLAQTIVVTATAAEYLAVDAPVRAQTITGLQCERAASGSLTEALTATVSGVRVEYTCQSCGAPSVRLSGLGGSYTQILEDGLPTMSNVGMVYALDQLSPEFYETIEVVKGGGSALYGPNAVAGVINLIRKEPKVNLVQLDAQTGWHHRRPEQSFRFAAQTSRLPGAIAADLHLLGLRSTHIDRNEDGFSDFPLRKEKGFSGTLYRRFLGGSARLSLSGTVYDELRRGGDHLDRKPEETFLTEMADSSRFSGLMRWNHTVSASTYYTLSAGLSYLGRNTYYGANFDPNAYGRTGNQVLVLDTQLGRQLGRHSVLTGWQYLREQVRDHILAYRRHLNEVYRNTGIYIQDEYRVTRTTTLVAGARLDRSNTLNHWVVSPRTNLRVAIADHWRWRLGVSTGFRAPVIYEEDLHVAAVGGEGFLLENSPGLREEKAVSVSSSVDYLGTLASRPLQVGFNLFSTRLRNTHTFAEIPVADGEFRKLLRVNGPGSRVRGVELDLSWRLHSRLALRAGASFERARYDEPEPQFGSIRYLRTPERYGFVTVDSALPRGITLLVTLDITGSMLVPHYAGHIPADRLEKTKRFKVLDFVLDRTLSATKDDRVKLRLYLRGTNLLDDFQPDLDRGPLRDSNYFYGPINMRKILAGIKVTFQ